MNRDVTFIIMTADTELAADLRAKMLGIDGVKVIADVDEQVMLSQAVQQFSVDGLLIDLDPSPDAILPAIAALMHEHRDLAVFTASSSTEGSLILKVMRTGVKEFLPKPIEVDALSEAVERVRAERPQHAHRGKLIAVLGTSGGVGATLIATNLAVELAQIASGRVTVVDLDYRFGQVATLLDVEPTYTLVDLCGSPEQLDRQLVASALTEHHSGVRALGRPAKLAEAELITAASCLGVASSLLELNEYVVTDGPTRFDVGSNSVLALADVTLLVVQQLVPCVRTAVRLLEYMREHGYNTDCVKLVCNRVGSTSGHLSVKDLSMTLGLDAFACLPDDWETASGSINLGEPLASHSPKSKLRCAIREIAQSLHAPQGQADEKAVRKPGLIGRIFANG